MARPKKNQKGYEIANERWHKTMLLRYGGEEGLHEKMQEIGRKGGRKGAADGVIKGFAANPTLAREAGSKGGRISRRNGVKNGEGKKRREEDELVESILES